MEQLRFNELLSKFSQANVAVLGDFFLDLYIQMDRTLSEFSLETHKEAFQAVDMRGQPGTAGVVVNNLAAMGAQTAAIGYIGKDGNGYTLRQALESINTNTDYLIETNDRFTPTYTKPIMREVDGRNIELNRIDVINRSPNPHALNLKLADNVCQAIAAYDAILTVEQVKKDGYGTMSPHLRNVLSKSAEDYSDKFIIVDSRHFAASYQGVILKMNLAEAVKAAKQLGDRPLDKEKDPQSTAELCARLFWDVYTKPVFITLGQDGISGMADNHFFYIPGFRTDSPIDIVGAGDSVLAGIGLALCVGATPKEAAYIGNLVGSITVQQIGTTGLATQADLRQRHTAYQNQIKE